MSTSDSLAHLLTGAADAVWRSSMVLPPPSPEADAAADAFLATTYASEGRRPLTRTERPAPIVPSHPPKAFR